MFEGMILGCVAWLSIVLSWWHMPQWFKNFTLRHPVMSDIASGVLIYLFLSSISKSLVAAVGAIVGGLMTNISLLIGSRS